jgi:hypothetical protein
MVVLAIVFTIVCGRRNEAYGGPALAFTRAQVSCTRTRITTCNDSMLQIALILPTVMVTAAAAHQLSAKVGLPPFLQVSGWILLSMNDACLHEHLLTYHQLSACLYHLSVSNTHTISPSCSRSASHFARSSSSSPSARRASSTRRTVVCSSFGWLSKRPFASRTPSKTRSVRIGGTTCTGHARMTCGSRSSSCS